MPPSDHHPTASGADSRTSSTCRSAVGEYSKHSLPVQRQHRGTPRIIPLEATAPSIGASGAVSGVMAVYLFLFTGERITTLIIPIPWLFRLPAWIYIIYSFGHDLLLGLLTEEFVKEHGLSPFGTDVFAHVGGLIIGLIFIYLYIPPEALVDRRRCH